MQPAPSGQLGNPARVRRPRWRAALTAWLLALSAFAVLGAAAHPVAASEPAGPTVVIANEQALADVAVAVGLAAGTPGATLLLTRNAASLGARARSALQSLRPARVLLVGGEAALSAELATEMAEHSPGIEVERVAGGGRVATSVKALRRAASASQPNSLAVAHGWTPADIAHGAAVAVSGGADGLLLVSCGRLEDMASSALADGAFERVVLVGKLATQRCASGALIEDVVGSGVVERWENAEPVEIVAAANEGRVPPSLQHGVMVDAGNLRETMLGVVTALGNRGSLVLYAHRDRISDATMAALVGWIPQSLTLIGATSALVEGVGQGRDGDAPGVSTSRTVYASVEAGNAHICGLLASGKIDCWGDGSDRRTDVPAGRFLAVSAGFRHTCALNTSHRVVCWGRSTYGRTAAPDGRFVAVAAGWQHSCGITESKRLQCWGRAKDGATRAPGGQYSSLSAGGGHTCALRTDGRIACWGANGTGESQPPSGRFIAVETGYAHSCGIRENGRIVCWGADVDGQKNAPPGQYIDLSLGQNFGCALDRQGAIRCWGADRDGASDAPDGEFVDVEVGGKVSCGLRTDGRVTCWGFRSLPAVADVILP